MTNQERAERIILGRTSTDAVQELHKAGLLMPDLPEPKYPGFWEVSEMGIHLVDKDGEVNLDWREGGYYEEEDRSLWLSRDQVLAILAAAKLAEEQ